MDQHGARILRPDRSPPNVEPAGRTERIRRSVGPMVVGRADDPAEREADGFADQVVSAMVHPPSASLGAVPVSSDGGRIRRAATNGDVLGGSRVDAGPVVRRRIDGDATLIPLATTSSSTIRRQGGEGTTKQYEKRTPDRRPGGRPDAPRVHQRLGETEAWANFHPPAQPYQIPQIPQIPQLANVPHQAPRQQRRLAMGNGQRLGQPLGDQRARAQQPAQVPQHAQQQQQPAQQQPAQAQQLDEGTLALLLQQLEDAVEGFQEAYVVLATEDNGSAKQSLALIKDIDAVLERFPKQFVVPEFKPWIRQLRNVRSEAQALLDIASMESINARAEEKYMADGAKKDGDGKMNHLDGRMRKQHFDRDTDFGDDNEARAKIERIRAAGVRLGLTPAQQTAITVFTSEEYKYINPATANSQSWMESNFQGGKNKTADQKKELFRSKRGEGSTHAAVAVRGLMRLPVWKGKTYRGEAFTEDEFLEKFSVGADVPSKKYASGIKHGAVTAIETAMTRSALSSNSSELAVAETFAGKSVSESTGGAKTWAVVWQYKLIDGRDIHELSDAADEAEIATLPGATFRVDSISSYSPKAKFIKDYQLIPENVYIVKSTQTA